MFDDGTYDDHMILIADCIRCGRLLTANPLTVTSVYVNTLTRCPLRPDATPIVPGEPGTQREPLCHACAPIIRAALGTPTPVHQLFPHARFNLITPQPPDEEN